MLRLPFSAIQPWGPDKGRQATVTSEYGTALEAFRDIYHLSSEMVRTRAPSEAIKLMVVDAADQIVSCQEDVSRVL